jgi:SAM-dependent methyltransferase
MAETRMDKGSWLGLISNRPSRRHPAPGRFGIAVRQSRSIDDFEIRSRHVVMKRVLNVGGNSKSIPLPPVYEGWEHLLLDVDPKGRPDVVCDAREMTSLPAATYDAVYCSHNLEHYHRHEVPRVLAGFRHVLKTDGFVHLRVPDIGAVMRIAVQRNLDIDDVLYQSRGRPITVRDVIYGWGVEIERSGNDFFAHKTGFSSKSLTAALHAAGFINVFVGIGNLEIIAYAFTGKASDSAIELLKLPVAAA